MDDALFVTLDPTTRLVRLPNRREVLFTDTVGFIQKLPTDLVAAFKATLEEVQQADLLLHVLDATRYNGRDQMEAVQDRKSTRLNSSHSQNSYAVFCLKKK